jgi:hypothetical protein
LKHPLWSVTLELHRQSNADTKTQAQPHRASRGPRQLAFLRHSLKVLSSGLNAILKFTTFYRERPEYLEALRRDL